MCDETKHVSSLDLYSLIRSRRSHDLSSGVHSPRRSVGQSLHTRPANQCTDIRTRLVSRLLHLVWSINQQTLWSGYISGPNVIQPIKNCLLFVKPECSVFHSRTTFGVVPQAHLYGSFFCIFHFNIIELSLRSFAELGEITIGPTAVIPVYFGGRPSLIQLYII
jgi:hypothetical protein